MASSFPTGLDSLTNPSGSDKLSGGPAAIVHSKQHSDVNDAIEALQARIGITGSLVPTSLDYEVHNTSSGHDHDGINSRPIKLGTSGSTGCSFEDGLFTDWTNLTEAGEAICLLNQVLKNLAPSPAPDLDNLDADNSGVTGRLSFGTSQGITGYTDVTGTGSLTAVNINGLYSVSTFTNDLRRGIFNASTTITGTLNEDVAADPPNHPANAFGNADKGEVVLDLNGVPFLSANLEITSGFIKVTSLNGTFLAVSASSPAQFSNGEILALFQHRRGSYSIAPGDQRKGWNFVRVFHRTTIGDPNTGTQTNYAAWVVDSDTTTLTAPSGSLHTVSMTGLRYLTGVKYYTGGTALYDTAISAAYQDVYSNGNAVSFPSTNISFGSQALSGITVGSEDETKVEVITKKVGTINSNKMVPGAITASVRCTHPLGPTLNGGGSSAVGEIFLYNKSANSTTLREQFQDENYRLLPSTGSNDYDLDADVPASGWDSTTDWSGSSEQLPLVVFCDSIRALPKLPDSTGGSGGRGDFTSFEYGPAGNVDYSDFDRHMYYYRRFENNSGGSRSNWALYMTGSGTVVTRSSDLGSNDNFKLEFKVPGKTGWNVYSPFELLGQPQIPDDDAGILDGAFNDVLPSRLDATIGTLFISASANIVMRITADENWTGCIEDISLVWT